MSNTLFDTGQIPDEFLTFHQEDVCSYGNSTFYMKLYKNKNLLEIRNFPRSFGHLSLFIGGYHLAVLLFTFLLWLLCHDVFVIIFPLAFCIVWILGPAFILTERTTSRKFWNTGTNDVRFSMDLSTGSLFFSKENVTLQNNEYKKMCFACIYGYPLGSEGGNGRPLTAQFSLLVQLNDGVWTRHLLTGDTMIIFKKTLRFYSRTCRCPVIETDRHGKTIVIDESQIVS